MRLLLCLAERAGRVVSIDELLNQIWPEANVSPDSVYQAVTSLRRLLGDDPKQPTYIATVPRLGYRMVAAVSPWSEPAPQAQPAPVQRRTNLLWMAAAVVCVALIVAFIFHGKTAGGKQSIAVLPFLDLTEGMNQESFADGMTEELIGRLSKIPGLQVPPPTSSFFFKEKKLPVGEIAKSLGVAYILDGSVRKSGARLRVAARLVRADTGYVVWSETYDRPFDDILMVQDDIAAEVTKALKSSIAAPAK